MPSGKKIDWSKYDQIIIDNISNYTITDLAKKFLPHISPRTINTRVKALGLKPKKYKPNKAHKKAIAKTICKLSHQDIKFIKNNRDALSVLEIAQQLKVSKSTVWKAIWDHNIQLSEAGYKRARMQSTTKQLGKIPWNKGIPLSEKTKIKIAKARQKQSGRLSLIQGTLYKLLEELKINHYKEYSDKCRFGPWLFDCRISHNNTDFLVEVQGDYIHSLPKTKSKDQAKSTYMRKYFPQIPIKYIWEHEFGSINKIKAKIKKWVNITSQTTYDFSFNNVVVKPINNTDEAKKFIAAFHYLDKLVGRIAIGAYLNNKLIAVSVWGAPTRFETAQRLNVKLNRCLELRRFVIHDSYHKKNFASWFLSRSEKLLPNNIEILVSFADPAANHNGSIYKATNWTYDGKTESSYYYISEDKYVMFKKTLYRKAHKMHMTELEFAETYNYTKIKSPPKFRFIKKL